MKKLKVAWICPLDFSRFRDRLTFHENPTEVIAPWITLLSEIFEDHTEEAELHIISAPPRLDRDATILEKDIYYHFISEKLPLIGRKSPFILKKATNYAMSRRKVKKLITAINPDIVEFHGAEHDLSWSFFDLDYPKMLTPQFFVNNYYRFRQTKYLGYWMKVEAKIYKACRNFSYRNEHMKREILALNPGARLYKYQYPIRRPQISANDFPLKNADIVFTARLIKSKGIEDLLQAVKLVKREFHDVKARIIGQCDPAYMEILKGLASALDIAGNVSFTGFLPTQEDLFEEMAKSKLSVLPTHFDLIPGSILEAMFIGTPVVAYAAGGLPELNRDSETVRLVEVGNIPLLAKEIIALLDNEALRQKLASVAEAYVVKTFDNNLIFNKMIHAYQSVIADDIIN